MAFPISRSTALSVALAVAAALAPMLGSAEQAPAGEADLVAKLLPAVVNISVKQAVPAAPGQSPEPGEEPGAVRTREALGSGFIIDPSGLIVTNRHVIDEAYEITVTLQDSTTLPAQVIGQGYIFDLALLKIDVGKPLPTVGFGDSDKLRVGDVVIAIGNPIGYGGSVSSGIVSALNRDIHETPIDDFIQTDAAINHGNSGGPLFNRKGEVIGVNTALVSPTSGSVGIGLALPSNDVVYVLNQLREYGRPRAGWIGLRLQQVSPQIAEALGLREARGGIVASVAKNGPTKGLIQDGDIILALEGEPIRDVRALNRSIAKSLGQTVRLTLWRDGVEQTVEVPVVEWPRERFNSAPQLAAFPQPPQTPDLGLHFSAIIPDLGAKYNLAADQRGALITKIDPESAAARAGLRLGDVILKIQLKSVSSPADVEQKLDEARKAHRLNILFFVQSRDDTRWVTLPLS